MAETPFQVKQAQREERLERTMIRVQDVLGWVGYLFGTLWATGAIYYDGPFGKDDGNTWLALGWALIALACLVLIRTRWTRAFAWLACFLVVLIPWLRLEPSNDREWRAEWAETPWVELNGAVLTFHNLRNFDYGADGTVTERWESRSYQLSELRGVDYLQDNFGGDLIAHPMLSFDFGPDGRLVLSVETRREVGESFSEFGGLYKMFDLQYLWGDERDFVRVRTNIHKEPVHLYRTRLTPEQTLYMLLDSVRETNLLRDQPRFYNVLTANCTTSLLAQTLELRETPFDIRMLANGRLDELIFEKDGFVSDDLSFPEMRERVLINEAAMAAHDAPDFSKRIRAGRPGFD